MFGRLCYTSFSSQFFCSLKLIRLSIDLMEQTESYLGAGRADQERGLGFCWKAVHPSLLRLKSWGVGQGELSSAETCRFFPHFQPTSLLAATVIGAFIWMDPTNRSQCVCGCPYRWSLWWNLRRMGKNMQAGCVPVKCGSFERFICYPRILANTKG